MLGLVLAASLVLASLGPATAAVNTVEHIYKARAVNRLIGEVVQSRRRPLLGPSPG